MTREGERDALRCHLAAAASGIAAVAPVGNHLFFSIACLLVLFAAPVIGLGLERWARAARQQEF